MALPNQPNTGGTNVGKIPMFGYNPYLEAGFSGLVPAPNAVFDLPSLLIPGAQYGVQTNCMTCHILATVDGGLGYTTDQYISLDTSLFLNKIQVDFAWSIQGNIIQNNAALKKNK